MMRSRALHLLISILFLLQTTIPAGALGAGSAGNTADTEVPEEIVQSLLDGLELQNELLAGLSVEMTAALDEIRATYPQQFSLWQKILTLPSSASASQELEKDIGITRAVLVSVTSYARHLSSLQTNYSKDSETAGQPDSRQVFDSAQLGNVLEVQDKIRTYELLNLGKINEINDRIRTVYDLQSSPEISEEMGRLEKQRSRLIKNFTTLLTKYESLKTGTAALREYNNAGFNNSFKEELSYYSDLAEFLQSETKSVRQAFRTELLGISTGRLKELQATLSILTTGKEGISWPLFEVISPYKPNHLNAKSNVLNDLDDSLRQMQPRLGVLRDILTARNALLFQTDFINKGDNSWLRYQLGLEDLRLEDLSVTLDQLDKLNETGSSSSNQNEAPLLEELGLQKEDILAIETLILDELLSQIRHHALADTDEGRNILAIMALQGDWQREWQPVAAEFDTIVSDFKDYQLNLLGNSIKTITTIKSDIERVSKRLSGKKSSAPLASFVSLLNNELSEQLIRTQQQLDTRIATIDQQSEDPLFHFVFGSRPERFWHDYHSMGLAIGGFQRLQNNKSRIRASLLSFTSPTLSSERQILSVLRLIQYCDINTQIDCSDNSCRVVIGSGSQRLVVDNLGEKSSTTLNYFSATSSEGTVLSILKDLLSGLRIVSPAHAGGWSSFSKWGGTVFGQMKKNWVGYAVTGVVITGALVAAPVVAAAGAATATVTAVSAGAAAVASGGAAAFYAQGYADVALGTSRFAINEMEFTGNKYATKENFNTALDVAETTYNITKLAEGIKNVVSPAQSADEIAGQVNKVQQATEAEKLSKVEKLQKIKDTADAVRRQMEAVENSGDAVKTPQQIANLLRDKRHLTKLERILKEGGEQIANITQKGAQNIDKIKGASTAVSATTRIGNQIADASGIPNGFNDSINGIKDLVKDKKDKATGGIPDICKEDPNKKLPGKCGCNKPDTDTDKDGTPDCNEECDNNPKLTKEGRCGCDDEIDADGDGVPSCNGLDVCDGNPKLTAKGKCGCDDEIDADGDGVPSCNEVCDDDPLKTNPGICGCKVADVDADANGIADCKETIDDDQVVDDLRNAENLGGDGNPQENTANNDQSTNNLPITSMPGSSAWQPSATDVTANERANSANAANAANQIKNNAQNQAAAYQALQTASQNQTAESLNQIDREQSAQMTDAIIGGVTSGVAQGVGTFGERVGQGAGIKAAEGITGHDYGHKSGGDKHTPDTAVMTNQPQTYPPKVIPANSKPPSKTPTKKNPPPKKQTVSKPKPGSDKQPGITYNGVPVTRADSKPTKKKTETKKPVKMPSSKMGEAIRQGAW